MNDPRLIPHLPLPPSAAPPNVYQKPFPSHERYTLLKNRSSIITSPLTRGPSERVKRAGRRGVGAGTLPHWCKSHSLLSRR